MNEQKPKQIDCERPGCFGKMITVERNGKLCLKCRECGLLIDYPIKENEKKD